MSFIRAGDRPFYADITAGPWHSKMLADAVSEVCMLTGYEWWVEPKEPATTFNGSGGLTAITYANEPKIGELVVDLPREKPDPALRSGTYPPVFEYGTARANVQSYKLSIDREAQANVVYVPRMGFPEPGYLGTEVTKIAQDTAAKTAFGGLAVWIDPAGIELATYRQRLADMHLALRKAVRRRITFTPTRNNSAQPFVDYTHGDWVQFRAFHGNTLRFDVMLRIYNINITLDDAGNESVELTTIEDNS